MCFSVYSSRCVSVWIYTGNLRLSFRVDSSILLFYIPLAFLSVILSLYIFSSISSLHHERIKASWIIIFLCPILFQNVPNSDYAFFTLSFSLTASLCNVSQHDVDEYMRSLWWKKLHWCDSCTLNCWKRILILFIPHAWRTQNMMNVAAENFTHS